MKTLLLLIVSLVTISCTNGSRAGNVDIPKSLYEEVAANREFDDVTTEPKLYDSLCKIEYGRGFIYPSKEVPRTLLHSATGRKWELSDTETMLLMTMLNDSANYEWGELGTPEVHYYFTFHNTKGKCIGVTTVDLEGMVYSTPSLNRMKWGAFKNMEAIDGIIDKVKGH